MQTRLKFVLSIIFASICLEIIIISVFLFESIGLMSFVSLQSFLLFTIVLASFDTYMVFYYKKNNEKKNIQKKEKRAQVHRFNDLRSYEVSEKFIEDYEKQKDENLRKLKQGLTPKNTLTITITHRKDSKFDCSFEYNLDTHHEGGILGMQSKREVIDYIKEYLEDALEPKNQKKNETSSNNYEAKQDLEKKRY